DRRAAVRSARGTDAGLTVRSCFGAPYLSLQGARDRQKPAGEAQEAPSVLDAPRFHALVEGVEAHEPVEGGGESWTGIGDRSIYSLADRAVQGHVEPVEGLDPLASVLALGERADAGPGHVAHDEERQRAPAQSPRQEQQALLESLLGSGQHEVPLDVVEGTRIAGFVERFSARYPDAARFVAAAQKAGLPICRLAGNVALEVLLEGHPRHLLMQRMARVGFQEPVL